MLAVPADASGAPIHRTQREGYEDLRHMPKTESEEVMRFIPPPIWSIAIALGHARAAWIETRHPNLPPVIWQMEKSITRFLEDTRKEKRK